MSIKTNIEDLLNKNQSNVSQKDIILNKIASGDYDPHFVKELYAAFEQNNEEKKKIEEEKKKYEDENITLREFVNKTEEERKLKEVTKQQLYIKTIMDRIGNDFELKEGTVNTNEIGKAIVEKGLTEVLYPALTIITHATGEWSKDRKQKDEEIENLKKEIEQLKTKNKSNELSFNKSLFLQQQQQQQQPQKRTLDTLLTSQQNTPQKQIVELQSSHSAGTKKKLQDYEVRFKRKFDDTFSSNNDTPVLQNTNTSNNVYNNDIDDDNVKKSQLYSNNVTPMGKNKVISTKAFSHVINYLDNDDNKQIPDINELRQPALQSVKNFFSTNN